MKLKIFHSNDVHSNFENFAKMVTLIKHHKDESTLILDAGDFADFKSIELQGTKGMAAIELLDYAGYEALTIGNNETFNGIETLEHMASHSPIPFISNNLLKKDKTKVNGVNRSIILHKNDLRILITGSSPDLDVFNDGLGVHILSYKEAIAEEIKRNEGCYDICILLSHVGTIADRELAKDIPEIDIILSAHDHQLYAKAEVVNTTIMNSAGKYGEYLGLVEIEVKDGRVELLHSETISTDGEIMDEQVLAILKKNKAIAIDVLSQPLYKLTKPLWHDVIEENPLANLIADGLKDMLNCEIGMINSGIVNAGAFDFLSNQKLIEICPSPLNPTSFEIKGIDLKRAIEQSLDVQSCLADGRGPGFRGKFVGRLHFSGVEISHEGRTLLHVLVGNEPLDEEKWYSVASSDYLQRGSGYPPLASNRKDKYRAEEIRDVIRMYANKPEFIESAYLNRWKQVMMVEV